MSKKNKVGRPPKVKDEEPDGLVSIEKILDDLPREEIIKFLGEERAYAQNRTSSEDHKHVSAVFTKAERKEIVNLGESCPTCGRIDYTEVDTQTDEIIKGVEKQNELE